MKITNPKDFITLGGMLRYLMGSNQGDRISGDGYTLSLLDDMDHLLDDLGFQVSKKLFEYVLKKLGNEFREAVKNETEDILAKMSKEQADKLSEEMKKLEHTIWAECGTRIIAVPVPRRFKLDSLLNNCEELLPKHVFNKLSDIGMYDFTQACRCIVFECPTAVAFHLLRCMEECVRILHRSYFPRGDREKKTWKILLDEVANKSRSPQADPTLLNHLDHLRERFRNPTDHPEKCFDIDEAQNLLHLCIDAITRVVQDGQVNKRGAKALKG